MLPHVDSLPKVNVGSFVLEKMKLNKEKIVYKKIEELHLNERNPRKNDNAVATVAKSIEKYGFRNPLIIDASGKIYCGNTRYKAAVELGLTECPCIIADDLTEQQIREYALLDNKSNELAEWDIDILGQELEDLDFGDFDLDWGLPSEVEYGGEQYEPDKFDDDLISQYEGHSESFLLRKRILITYTTEQELALKEFLRLPADDNLKVVYDITELIK